MILRRAIIFLIITLFSISILFSLSPLKTVENSNVKVLNIYKKNKLITKRIVEEVFKVISTVSNFRNTAVKIALPYRNNLSPSEYRKFIEIMEKLKEKGAQGVVLGCTEIPLIIKQNDFDLPLFNTLEIHAKRAVEFALSN